MRSSITLAGCTGFGVPGDMSRGLNVGDEDMLELRTRSIVMGMVCSPILDFLDVASSI